MNLTFVINVWRDDELAKRLRGQLRDFYPDATKVFMPDQPRLKHLFTGEWSERYLRVGIHTGADVIVKLDPDTCAWRRADLPEAECFGTLSNDGTFIRGGAIGFSRATAMKLVDSGLLLRPSPHTYPRYELFRWPHEDGDDKPLSCQDRTVGDALRSLNIPLTPWDEVLILGNDNVSPAPARHAFTHPHPRLEVDKSACIA